MSNDGVSTAAGRQYAAAHAAHYATKDLHEALDLYRGVMVAHPSTPEAGYSRTQIDNIVKSVVPEEDLLAAHIALILACFEREETSDVQPAPLTPLASERLG